MTVAELIEVLKTYPPELEVLTTRYSDLQRLTPEDVGLIQAKPQKEWIMRDHHTAKGERTTYLHFAGN